jgi:hypothetical protein
LDHSPSAPRGAGYGITRGKAGGNRGATLRVTDHFAAGAQGDMGIVAAAAQPHTMRVAAMDHGTRVAEPPAERLAELDVVISSAVIAPIRRSRLT